LGEIGVKSNSKTVAFLETMVIPEAANVASKFESPSQEVEPSLRIEVFGPDAFVALPVLITTPLCIGKFGFVFWKYPIPLDEPKFVPVLQEILVAETQGELINTLFTNCGTV
jgi:hypothetical protein